MKRSTESSFGFSKSNERKSSPVDFLDRGNLPCPSLMVKRNNFALAKAEAAPTEAARFI